MFSVFQGCRNDFELTGSNQHKRHLLSGSLELTENSSSSLEPVEPPLKTDLPLTTTDCKSQKELKIYTVQWWPFEILQQKCFLAFRVCTLK